MNELVKISIILAVYNGEKTILKTINSVLNQSHTNFELIVVNDGSTDQTQGILEELTDERLVLINQDNKGVSEARNVGLDRVSGDYFCFIDADDIMPERSLEARLNVFTKREDLVFVDGKVEERDLESERLIRSYLPRFEGNPLKELIMLNDSCFCGQTWMIKNVFDNKIPKFDPSLTHGEDVTFFIECIIQSQGNYSFTNELILVYNRHSGSAMGNIDGLREFYTRHYESCENYLVKGLISKEEMKTLRLKMKSILVKSYLKKGELAKALNMQIRF